MLAYRPMIEHFLLFYLQCEPSLLPEPNHVMLNHLYALSIKVSLVNMVYFVL